MNRTEAVDTMMLHVKDAVPLGCVILWPDTPAVIPENVQWVRPSVKHVDSRQSALSGQTGTRRFSRKGILVIQCFSLIGDGHTGADLLCGTITENLEKLRNSPIWYRNIRAIEVGKEGTTMQVNVIADFEYEQIH